MSKAFTREDDSSGEPLRPVEPWPTGVRNYLTPEGYARLKADVEQARSREARSRGDERLRALLDRLEAAEVIDAEPSDVVRFGATVTVEDDDGERRRYRIVGVDEADPASGLVSWRSPLARALLGRRVGDEVTLRTPGGDVRLTVIDIRYESSREGAATASDGETPRRM